MDKNAKVAISVFIISITSFCAGMNYNIYGIFIGTVGLVIGTAYLMIDNKNKME